MQAHCLDRRLQKEKEKSFTLFDQEVNLIDSAKSDGNFHMKEKAIKEQYEKSATQGHFAPLLRRIEVIEESIDDIIRF